jgi:hypothetical protein
MELQVRLKYENCREWIEITGCNFGIYDPKGLFGRAPRPLLRLVLGICIFGRAGVVAITALYLYYGFMVNWLGSIS